MADASPRTETSTDDTEDKNTMVTSLASILSLYTALESVLSVFLLFFLQRCCFICHFGIHFSKRHNLLYFRANCFPCDIIPLSVLLDTIFWVKFFGLFSVVKLNCAD